MNLKSLLGAALFTLGVLVTPSAQPMASVSEPMALGTRLKNDNIFPATVESTLHRSPGFSSPTFKNLARYIADHLVYPEAARENGIEGQVLVAVTISETGVVDNASVTRGLPLGCDEAALAMVRQMPAWTPATLDGQPVRSQATMALNFRLR